MFDAIENTAKIDSMLRGPKSLLILQAQHIREKKPVSIRKTNTKVGGYDLDGNGWLDINKRDALGQF